MTQAQSGRIKEMRKVGMTYEQIASEMKLSKSSIKSFCRRNGLLDRELENPLIQAQTALACPQCEKPLVQHPNRKPRRFCSDACRYKWWNAHRNEKGASSMRQYECLSCHRAFRAYAMQRRYCSRECYLADRYGKERKP